ncbi:hypothetical protein R6Q57_022162 [Mikania cordata]
MSGHKYATKGYSDYNDFPAQPAGYAYEPEPHAKWYVVETRVERFRAPTYRYAKFGGAPVKEELFEEHMPKYAYSGRHEGYEPLYGSDYENLDSTHDPEGEKLMANFLNKLQIGINPPMSEFSGKSKYRPTSPNKLRTAGSNKYLPDSPNKYQPASPNKHRPASPNKYQPANPNKHRPASPNKYQPASPNKHRPASPKKYQPASPNKHRPTSPNKQLLAISDKHPTIIPNKLLPTSPNKQRTASPNKYRDTSPSKYHITSTKTYNSTSPKRYPPTSPNKYHATTPHKYQATSPKKYHATSPNEYRPTSPNNYRPTSPNNYLPTSPNKYRFSSPNKYRPESPNNYKPISPKKYRPTSPYKYQSTSPRKYRSTSLTHGYPSNESDMSKSQIFSGPNKYRPASPTKYQPISSTHNHPSKEDNINWSQDLPGPKKYQPANSAQSFPSKEIQPTRTQSLSDPNKDHASSRGAKGGRYIKVIDYSNPQNYHWQTTGPPTTSHSLTGPTNDINEALGFLIESVNYPSQFDTNRGAFPNLVPRAQPVEQERRFARPTFGGVPPNRPYKTSSMIDSEEAVRRYNGAYVP